MASPDPEPAAPHPNSTPTSPAGLRQLATRPGPFATLFLAPGSAARSRARLAIDRAPIPAPHAGILVDAVQDESAQSRAVVVDGTSRPWRFVVDEPFVVDLARFGDVPTVGPLLEAHQLTVSHVVVTVENDAYGLTTFGAIEHEENEQTYGDGRSDSIFEAFDHLVEALEARSPELIALVGTASTIADTAHQLGRRLPPVAVNVYPTDDIDGDLLHIADQVVRDAASLAAERRTQEIGQFREARSAGQAVEGPATLAAVEAGAVRRVLVHDDLADQTASAGDTTRFVDRLIREALLRDIPITMIPRVADGRGPRGGIGGILAAAHDPTLDTVSAATDDDATVSAATDDDVTVDA